MIVALDHLSWLGYVQTAEKLTGEHQLNRFKSSAFYIKFHTRGLVLYVFSAEELGKSKAYTVSRESCIWQNENGSCEAGPNSKYW
jgi:hypothetical protein